MVLALGTLVLLLAILIGQRMGDRVLGSATERRLEGISAIAITPAPNQTSHPYGPDWSRSQALTAAPDPNFPDPRVPPQALPTPVPRPSSASAPVKAVATPNPAIPIWRQRPLPTMTPGPALKASATPTPQAGQSPVPGPSPAPPTHP